jgi:ABC-2 type transport system permease protein
MIRVIKKYAGLYHAFFSASLAADLEFRFNFAVRIVTDIFWYAAQLATFEVLYNFTDSIGSWGRAEMRVFLGLLFVIDAINMIIFSTGLDNISESVRKGSLDLLLTKPVNSQFMISCQRASTANIGNLAMAVGWLIWAVGNLEGFQYARLLWLILMIPAGATIFYVLRFCFAAAAVIFTRAENLQFIWYNFYRMGMRPDNIYYPYFIRWIVITVLPVGLIISVPARMVLGTAGFGLAAYTMVLAVVLLYLSNRFWKFALSRYASASS